MSGTSATVQEYRQDTEQNRVLRGLPVPSYMRLRPYLEPVELALKQVLWNADDEIESAV